MMGRSGRLGMKGTVGDAMQFETFAIQHLIMFVVGVMLIQTIYRTIRDW